MSQHPQAGVKPPGQFTVGTDWSLWMKRFEIYVREAEIPPAKKATELISLLGDEPFRIVCQLGLDDTTDFNAVRRHLEQQYAPIGLEREWQYKLQHCQQKRQQSLTEFAAELRMLVDKAYP